MSIFSRNASVKVAHLTADELTDLRRHEGTIHEYKTTYPKVGLALRAIRDRALFRSHFETFEAYCLEKWDITPQHAGRLIAAAQVAANLEPLGTIPPTERHARPLTAFEATEQIAIWEEAQELAEDRQPTASQVETAAARRRTKKQKKAKVKPIRLRLPSGSLVLTPGRNFSNVESFLLEALAKVQRKEAA